MTPGPAHRDLITRYDSRNKLRAANRAHRDLITRYNLRNKIRTADSDSDDPSSGTEAQVAKVGSQALPVKRPRKAEGRGPHRQEVWRHSCPMPGFDLLPDIPRWNSAVENGCLHKDAICEFCQQTVAFVEISTHHNFECENAMAECPACKGQVVRHSV